MMVFRSMMVAAVMMLGVAGCEGESAETETVETGTAETGAAQTGAPETASPETQASFDSLVSVTNAHIRGGNFEAADTSLREMETMRPQLTEAMRQQIDTMRASLAAARSGTAPAGGATTGPTAPPPAAR